MTLQILAQSVAQHDHLSFVPSQRLITGLRILALTIVLALAISGGQSAEATMRSDLAPATFESHDTDSFANYTERYWNMATEHEAVTAAPAENAVTYTDRYWQLANAPANKNPDFANYTERYRDMAAEHKAMTTVSNPAEDALSELDSQPEISYSGDDTYDLAADGQPTETPANYAKRFSGDDAYDLAAGGLFYEPTVRYVSNFSGDDTYDLAADGQPAETPVRYVKRFSGDDDYDPAAGGMYFETSIKIVENLSSDDG